MYEVWSHAADVTYMGPMGDYARGWKQVKASWDEQAAMQLGGSVEAIEVVIVAGETLGLVTDIEQGRNTVQGKPQVVHIRATNVYRQEDGRWKMIHHHADILPLMEADAE